MELQAELSKIEEESADLEEEFNEAMNAIENKRKLGAERRRAAADAEVSGGGGFATGRGRTSAAFAHPPYAIVGNAAAGGGGVQDKPFTNADIRAAAAFAHPPYTTVGNAAAGGGGGDERTFTNADTRAAGGRGTYHYKYKQTWRRPNPPQRGQPQGGV